jgi:hypothetical protein
MVSIGNSLYKALNSGQLLLFGLAVLLTETLLRIGLAWQFGSLLLLAWPPVIAVLAFGLAHAHVRGQRFGAKPVVGLSRWLGLGVMLLAIGLLGHLFALLFGGAIFVIVDTPLRAVWYFLGIELFQWPTITLGLSFLGFALGVAIAWAVPAVLVAAVTGGLRLRSALGYLLTRRTVIDRVAVLNMLVVVGAPLSALVGNLLLSVPVNTDNPTLWPFVLVTVVMFCTLGVVPLAGSVLASRRGATESDVVGTESTVSSSLGTVARLSVALVLVVSLATAAGYARSNEIRPMEAPETTFYDDSPESMVASAQLNTLRVSHSGHVYNLTADGNRELEEMWIYDRQNRQAYARDNGSLVSATATRIGGSPAPIAHSAVSVLLKRDRTSTNGFADTPNIYVPGNPEFVSRGAVYRVPGPGDNADVVTNTDDEIVLRTTDIEYIAAIDGYDRDEIEEYHEGWMEITIDTESKTLQTVEYRYEVTLREEELEPGDDPRQTGHVRWEFSTDRPFEYPEEFDSLSLEERIWELIIY